MNTIPLTFNDHQIDRTVLGDEPSSLNCKLNVSVIMLNTSGSHLRFQTLDNLVSCGFRSIISVEPNRDSYNLEDLSRRYPSIKFVVPLQKATDGELINMCMTEVSSPYVLVLRDTMHIPPNILTSNLAENLTKDKTFCIVPRLFECSGSPVLVNIIPEARKGRFCLTQVNYITDGLSTLFPFDYCGLYNREKFIQLGGYDYTIESPYWQNADLSMRAWLWGEEIKVFPSFKISYSTEAPVLDSTRNLSYVKFYIKNLLPKFREDHGYVSSWSFFGFLFHSASGILETVSQFKQAKKWTSLNKYRFKTDAKTLIENWVVTK